MKSSSRWLHPSCGALRRYAQGGTLGKGTVNYMMRTPDQVAQANDTRPLRDLAMAPRPQDGVDASISGLATMSKLEMRSGGLGSKPGSGGMLGDPVRSSMTYQPSMASTKDYKQPADEQVLQLPSLNGTGTWV